MQTSQLGPVSVIEGYLKKQKTKKSIINIFQKYIKRYFALDIVSDTISYASAKGKKSSKVNIYL